MSSYTNKCFVLHYTYTLTADTLEDRVRHHQQKKLKLDQPNSTASDVTNE